MRAASFIVALMLAACAAPHAYLETQRVASVARFTRGRELDKWGLGLNVIFPITKRLSFQAQPVVTFGGEWVARTAFVWELF